MSRPSALLPLLLVLSFPLLPASHAAEGDSSPYRELKYRLIGPAIGGRVSRACGVAGDPLTYYAATASGGVWKSSDGGFHWKPIFDDQPVSSVGSIAVAPSDPNVVYVGSGEANIRGNAAAGNGIYRSTDAGRTWQHVWKQEGQIGQIVVHPTNPDVCFAAVLGHAFGPNPERGVYRTLDGGKTWQRVLHKDAETGASDVCFDPSNPRILFAGLWQARRRPWELTSGGPGSGLYRSDDGGDTWTSLRNPEDADDDDAWGKGLPDGIWGKVTVAVARSDGRRVYSLIEAEKGGLFRSDDGGKTWANVNSNRIVRQRPWYFSCLTIDPVNADVIWFPQVPMLKSVDGGKTLQVVKGPHHVDHHDVWIDPLNPKRMIDSNDGGVDISLNGGETWFAPPLPIGQFYHIAADWQTPYRVYGCLQDLGSASAPSDTLTSDGITAGAWQPVGGGEAGFAEPDPRDPEIVYAGEYAGYISRFDRRTGQARNVSIYPANPSGHGAEDMKYRFQWTAPILVSRHDGSLYHGGNVVFRSTDGGKTWQKISPDLTRDDKAKQKWSGGPITGDNTGVETYCTVFALAESPLRQGLLWAGSDDGLVHVSRDGGKTWDNVTANIPGIPEWGTVVCIEPSHFDADTAYLVVDAHRLDDMRPYLWKTGDGGKTWKPLTANLAPEVCLHVVREDPVRKGMLFLGTERGVEFSTDDGSTWSPLKQNLPTVAVHDLVIRNDDLVVGTHGRSAWILDDITPLRAINEQVWGEDATLFPPAAAIRWRLSGALDAKVGENPERGATLHYYLKQKPKEPIRLEVLDAEGKRVRLLSSKAEKVPPKEGDVEASFRPRKVIELPAKVGINRFVWDLQYEGAREIAGAKIDAGTPREGPLVNPGTYTLKLTAGGKTLTQKLEVRMDPRWKGGPGEAAENLRFALAVRDDLTRLSTAVEQLRSVVRQTKDRIAAVEKRPQSKELVPPGQALIGKLEAVEDRLHNPKAVVTYDILAMKGGAKLYSQFGALYEWAKDSDGEPTQGMRERFTELRRELEQHMAALQSVLRADVAEFNETARKLGVPGILLPES